MINKLPDNLYYFLFFIFVILDVLTTTYIFQNNLGIESNYRIDYIYTNFNLPFSFLIFWMLKFFALEFIIHVINYQNTIFKYSGYIIYTITILISFQIGIDNLKLIL